MFSASSALDAEFSAALTPSVSHFFRTSKGALMPDRPALMTCAEAAEVLRTGPWVVMRLCRSGKLRATKPTKQWLIDPADLRAYIDAHTNQPGDDTEAAAS